MTKRKNKKREKKNYKNKASGFTRNMGHGTWEQISRARLTTARNQWRQMDLRFSFTRTFSFDLYFL